MQSRVGASPPSYVMSCHISKSSYVGDVTTVHAITGGPLEDNPILLAGKWGPTRKLTVLAGRCGGGNDGAAGRSRAARGAHMQEGYLRWLAVAPASIVCALHLCKCKCIRLSVRKSMETRQGLRQGGGA